MTDVMVTVPKARWAEWIAEGDLPGEQWEGDEWAFYVGRIAPDMQRGDRVYIVAHGKLRGWSVLERIERDRYDGTFSLIRRGDAHACTIARPIVGFRGWKYRDWERAEEVPFPEWRQP